MGLKTDIKTAFLNAIEPDEINPGGEVSGKNFEGYVLSAKADKKIDDLAQELENAIVAFITAQPFKILEMEASQAGAAVVTPVGPGTVTMTTVKISKDGKGADNPMAGGSVESMTSLVQLEKADVTGLG